MSSVAGLSESWMDSGRAAKWGAGLLTKLISSELTGIEPAIWRLPNHPAALLQAMEGLGGYGSLRLRPTPPAGEPLTLRQFL